MIEKFKRVDIHGLMVRGNRKATLLSSWLGHPQEENKVITETRMLVNKWYDKRLVLENE